jgi:hypothetical protein
MMKVYLSGYINGKMIERCAEWRKKLRDHYDHWKGGERYPIEWIDPLNGKDYEKMSPDGMTLENVSPNAVVHRDYYSVKISDLIVANMDTFGEPRPLIGTISELAWAWEQRKPIIIITEDYNFMNHPFTVSFGSFFVKTVEELIEKKYINYFYKGMNSALY